MKNSDRGIKKKHDLFLVIVKIVAVLCMTGLFAAVWFLFYKKTSIIIFYKRGDSAVLLLYALFFAFFSKIYEALLVSMKRVRDLVYSQALAVAFSDICIYFVICILSKSFPSLVPGLICFFGQLGAAVLWALFANRLYYNFFNSQSSIIVFGTREGLEHVIQQYKLDNKYDIKAVVNDEDCLKNLSMLDDMDVAFISGISSHERNIILKYCIDKDVTVFVIPRIGDVIMSGAKRVHLFYIPILQIGRYNPPLEFSVVKRIMDIVISIIALIVLSPLMLATIIAIKIEDGGPAFYVQDRLTRDGQIFRLIKFRSMKVDAEKDGIARLSAGDHDERITRTGSIIRKFRIDEIPQFYNILKGEMSLIGPRPERPEIAAQYEKIMPEFRLRLQAKAGLTGYAQVYGKYNSSPYDKLQMDLLYLANPSLIEEISIIFATIKILFIPESTEGISKEQVTAMDSKQLKDDNLNEE